MSHARFFQLLDKTTPAIKSLWKKETGELDISSLDHALAFMGSGEQTMARFFAGIWMGSNHTHRFDLFSAMKCVDGKSREIIVEWVQNPFFP